MKDDNLLHTMRQELGINQSEASRKLNISRQAWHNAEKNYPDIALNTLVRYASALGFKIEINVVGESPKQ